MKYTSFSLLATFVSVIFITSNLAFAEGEAAVAETGSSESSSEDLKMAEIELPEVPPKKLAKIKQVLSIRHKAYTKEKLEKIAGSEAALIASLLELRKEEELPYVPYRAVKLLLGYSNYGVVKEAIEADFNSPDMRGVAQVITVHIDKMNHPAVRRHIAKMAMSQAETDQSFMPYAKALVDSSDAEVRKIARESLR